MRKAFNDPTHLLESGVANKEEGRNIYILDKGPLATGRQIANSWFPTRGNFALMPLFLLPCLDESSLRPKGKTCLYIMETDAFILEDDNLSWLGKISSHWSHWEWTQMLCIMVFKVTLLIRVTMQHSFSRHEKR